MRVSPGHLVSIASIAVSVLAGVALNGCTHPGPASAPGPITGQVPPRAVIEPAALSRYAGAEACAECHGGVHAAHARSMHAKTIFPAREAPAARYFETAQQLSDPAIGASYTFTRAGRTPTVRIQPPGGQPPVEMSPAYLIGTGHFGVTPIYEHDGVYYEGRTSYFGHEKRWHWTPGQHELVAGRPAAGRQLSGEEAINCFLCHGTAVVKTAAGFDPAQSRLNVSCERCHGPAAAHVAAERAHRGVGPIYSYRGASAELIVKLCSDCHRGPGVLTPAELATSTDLPRFAGTALVQSPCYQKSGSRLSCVTCHSPHDTVSTVAADYERVCKSCHAGESAGPPQTWKPCPVNRVSGCVSCHMPARKLDMPTDAKFHMHWIRVYGEGSRAGTSRKVPE